MLRRGHGYSTTTAAEKKFFRNAGPRNVNARDNRIRSGCEARYSGSAEGSTRVIVSARKSHREKQPHYDLPRK